MVASPDARTPSSAAPAFRVLFVCTGNICRSAAAEVLLRGHVEKSGADGVVVESAGTGALDGYDVDGPTALALRELGAEPDGHVARSLTPAMLQASDLVLTATTAHREAVLNAFPLAMRRTFTMKEFVRLGQGVTAAGGPADAKGTVVAVAGQRGLVDPAGPGADDIADPFGSGLAVARVTVAEVAAAVDETARLLGLD